MPCLPYPSLDKACPMCTEEAAVPLPILALSLLFSYGQQAVIEAAANGQPSHPALGQGSEPCRPSSGWSPPHTLQAGILPTCRGHCLPGPCCALSGRSLCAKLRGRCWALLRPLATGPADLRVESVGWYNCSSCCL